MITLSIIILLIVITFFYGIALYNRFIRLHNLAREGWSGIEVQLKQRADLIPNLVEAVKGYMGHEGSVLAELTKLRTQCLAPSNIEERAANETRMSAVLGKFFAVAESYPDLKASQNFLDLQKNLAAIEYQLQLARRYYNGTVRDFNIMVESFPSNFVANFMHFSLKPYFEIDKAEDRLVPQIKF